VVSALQPHPGLPYGRRPSVACPAGQTYGLHGRHAGGRACRPTIALVFGFLGLFFDPFLLFIALFVWIGASGEAGMVQMRTSLGGIPVQRVMLRDFRALQPDETLAQAVEYILSGWQQDFPVVFGDRVLGVLTREDLVRAIAEGGTDLHVRDAMRRDFQAVDSHDMLEQAVQVLQQSRCRSLPVEHNGRGDADTRKRGGVYDDSLGHATCKSSCAGG